MLGPEFRKPGSGSQFPESCLLLRESDGCLEAFLALRGALRWRREQDLGPEAQQLWFVPSAEQRQQPATSYADSDRQMEAARRK